MDPLKSPNWVSFSCFMLDEVWIMSKEIKNESIKGRNQTRNSVWVQILKQRNVALIIVLIQTTWLLLTCFSSHQSHTITPMALLHTLNELQDIFISFSEFDFLCYHLNCFFLPHTHIRDTPVKFRYTFIWDYIIAHTSCVKTGLHVSDCGRHSKKSVTVSQPSNKDKNWPPSESFLIMAKKVKNQEHSTNVYCLIKLIKQSPITWWHDWLLGYSVDTWF